MYVVPRPSEYRRVSSDDRSTSRRRRRKDRSSPSWDFGVLVVVVVRKNTLEGVGESFDVPLP